MKTYQPFEKLIKTLAQSCHNTTYSTEYQQGAT